MHDDELTPAEREAFAALPRESLASDLLEERTVRALAARGLIHPRQRIRAAVVWTGAAAACLLFFVAGFSLGQKRSVQPAALFPAGAETQESGTPTSTSTRGTTLERAAGDEGGSSVAMDTSGSLALGQPELQAKARTQVVVWF